MEISQELLEIIDKRIDTYLKSSKVICRYTAKIISKVDSGYRVQLLGYDTIFTFPAREYISAYPGQYVLIEAKASNLSNGIITDVLGNKAT